MSSSSSSVLPASARKVVVHTLSSDFRAATRIDTFPLGAQAIERLKNDQVLVRNHYAGINASDINYTAGKYTPGLKPPMDAGFEAIGVVAAVGKDVKNLKVGDAVLATSYGAFSEYQVHRAKQVLPMPSPDPSFIPLLVSGLTASIALEVTGELKQVGVNGQKQETVLVTAAAGGTGLFAVQLAKLLGHHVIGTCSSDDKVDVLKRLGCDRVINYKKENFGLVLKKEYPRGIDVVYESVGGDMFVECVRHLAVKGRLIVIGFVSGYADGSGWSSGKGDPAQAKRPPPPLAAMILGKSASIRGFFLNDFTELFKRHLHQLSTKIAGGQLQSIVDPQTFVGLEAVPDAIDYLYQGKNVGKVVVDLAPELHQQAKKGATLKSKL